MMASISNAKVLRCGTALLLFEQEKKHLERRLALEGKMGKQGSAEEKLGKHEVPQVHIDTLKDS